MSTRRGAQARSRVEALARFHAAGAASAVVMGSVPSPAGLPPGAAVDRDFRQPWT